MTNEETLQAYNTRLSENNTELDSILKTINNLPESSSESGGGNVENYSLEEQVIGTWVNDKPLYRKTYFINEGITSSMSVDISDLNIDVIMFKNVMVSYSDSYSTYTRSEFADSSTTSFGVFYRNGKLEIRVNLSNATFNYVVVVYEYTKTTD